MIDEEWMKVHDDLADILALAYARVDWRRITSRRRTALDIFTDRLRTAAAEPDMASAIDRLCKQLGISSIAPDPDRMRSIIKRNDEAMRAMRENAIYLAVLSKDKARPRKD